MVQDETLDNRRVYQVALDLQRNENGFFQVFLQEKAVEHPDVFDGEGCRICRVALNVRRRLEKSVTVLAQFQG